MVVSKVLRGRASPVRCGTLQTRLGRCRLRQARNRTGSAIVEWMMPVGKSWGPGAYKSAQQWRKRTILDAPDRRCGSCVAGGPFGGMRYLDQAVGSAIAPKLVGSYEAELHSIFLNIPRGDYSAVIDIGCAEGYYAVGLARLLPGVPVFAYETDPRAQALCREMAMINDAQDQVHIAGTLGRPELLPRAGQRIFLICDCEGYEMDLFDEQVAHALSRSDVIVETHDMYRAGCTEKLLAVFAATHQCSVLTPQRRKWARFPAARAVPLVIRKFAFDEWRHPMQRWIWGKARATA